ncbi:terminase small subunit [Mucilaginibacter limnophilus]|nr:terminase small subunit [Mucilaginibacter limnophilus]
MNSCFTSAGKLRTKICAYFKNLKKASPEINDTSTKTNASVKADSPATISGLMLHLGFNSRKEYDEYEKNGEFRDILKRARLRIEAEYEKKLHYQSSTGAIFALKNLGWNDREENESFNGAVTLSIEIVNSPHNPASAENEVAL